MKNLQELALKECSLSLNAMMHHMQRMQSGEKGEMATKSALRLELAELEDSLWRLIDHNKRIPNEI